MKTCIIGMGEIGLGLYHAMNASGTNEISGVDVNPKRIQLLQEQGLNVSNRIPTDCDAYIIAVLLTDQVVDVLTNNHFPPNSLIIIESTILPGTSKKILEMNPDMKLVVFPHRYDPETQDMHGFLNISTKFRRVLGAKDEETMGEAQEYLSQYMNTQFIHPTSLEVAELCKPLENAIRYCEIALAEELKVLCEKNDFDYAEVRAAINTKWNMDLKEARDGIGRHCLPKDVQLMDRLFADNTFFKTAMNADSAYRSHLEHNGLATAPIMVDGSKIRHRVK